ncbi:hypothetical protein D043_2878A, partial [Vibrio parahaemolyticus EKP-021]
MLISHNAWM